MIQELVIGGFVGPAVPILAFFSAGRFFPEPELLFFLSNDDLLLHAVPLAPEQVLRIAELLGLAVLLLAGVFAGSEILGL